MLSNISICLLAAIVAIEINYIYGQCQPGWTFYQNSKSGHCYRVFLSNYFTQNYANDACNIMKGYLDWIEDQDEFNFMTSTLLRNYTANIANLNGGNRVWVFMIYFI